MKMFSELEKFFSAFTVYFSLFVVEIEDKKLRSNIKKVNHLIHIFRYVFTLCPRYFVTAPPLRCNSKIQKSNKKSFQTHR